MGPGLTLNFCLENRLKIALNQYLLIFWSSIFCLYTLLKVVSYYDLSVLCMSVMGFQQQQKSLNVGVGGVSYIQFYFGFLEFV